MAGNHLQSHQPLCSSAAEPQQMSRSSSSLSVRRTPNSGRKTSVCVSAVPTRTLLSQHSPENAARERSRVRNLRQAFLSLQAALPSVPPNTKLSKLDILVLATNYISYLTHTLDQGETANELTVPSRLDGYFHPVKKWPMRSLLYCGRVGKLLSMEAANQTLPPGQDGEHQNCPSEASGGV